uniref:Saposin B-type domain-containing protein n=1 Tax=Ascaris lumbricoides TaxID=6252 RepID=A0A0M3IGK5_ASCLU
MTMKQNATMLVLLMLAALLSAQVVQRDFACRICDRLVPALRVSQYQIGSCHDRLPLELCNAVEKTLAIKMHTRYQEALCQPSFCVRYTAECTCAISKTLMQVAETNKEQPEDEFEKRLRLTCTQLDFLDPPCNMIVDEYAKKMHELALNGIPAETACKEIGLCQ